MKRRRFFSALAAMLLAACRGLSAPPPIPEATATPAVTPTTPADDLEPAAWSARMVATVLARRPVLVGRWHYELGLVLWAICEAWQKAEPPEYLDYIRHNVDPLLDDEGRIAGYRLEDYNLDQIAGGRVLLWLHERTGVARYRLAAERLREQLRRQPRTQDGGFWHKAIYPHQMWLDGLYMAAPFYAAYARLFDEPAAFADLVRQFTLIEEHLRDPRTGLYYHGWDERCAQPWADPATGRSPCFWGRGVGWLAMALVDTLDLLPSDQPGRARLAAMWRALADALTAVQDAASGLWRQVLDQGSREGNYLEASASAMFIYALAKGVRQGHLAREHLMAAARAYRGLIERLVTVDEGGLVRLHGICQMAGLGGEARRDGTFAYYISEPVVSDDRKGIGAFILAGMELQRAVDGQRSRINPGVTASPQRRATSAE